MSLTTNKLKQSVMFSQIPETTDLIDTQLISRPNGQGAYLDGSLPADHYVVFDYPDCVRTLHTTKNATVHVWKVYDKKDYTFEEVCQMLTLFGV